MMSKRAFAGLGAVVGLCVALIAGVTAIGGGGSASAEPSLPKLTGRVVDDAHLLSAAGVEKLKALSAEHEKQTGNQVVIATVPSLDGQDIREYGNALGRAWQIGQKGKNNGVLILVAKAEHKASIEVGYGLEGELTDIQTKLIIENTMLPYFKQGNFDQGLFDATVQVMRTIGGKPTGGDMVPQLEDYQKKDSGPAGVVVFILIALFVLFGRHLWPLLFLGGWGGGGGGFGGGGFSGGGGFGGGGFSGGGGSFGGGGASGSW